MKRLKIKIFIALATALGFTTVGAAGAYTNWLHRKPLVCFSAKSLSTDTANTSYYPYRKACVTHVVRPFAEKQGSIILDISIYLKDGRTLYFQTIFWMAKDIGQNRFSDIPGDFSTTFFQIFNKYGFSTLKISDTSSGWESANLSPNDWQKLCTYTPILLNKLHFSESCKSSQVLLWKIIAKSQVLSLNQSYVPIDVRVNKFIISNFFPILFIIFSFLMILKVIQAYHFHILILKFKPFNAIQDSFHSLSSSMHKSLPEKAGYAHYKQYLYLIIATGLIIVINLVSTKINQFSPNNISCKAYRLNTKTEASFKPKFLNYSDFEICLNEIIYPLDNWLGIVNVSITIFDNSGKSIDADAVFFIKETSNFSDSSGDIMYQKLRYYDSRGILVDENSDITSEHHENILTGNASQALWLKVRDQTTKVVNTKYISPFRLIKSELTKSASYMTAAFLLIYAYYLFLQFLLSGSNRVESEPDSE